MVAWTEYKSTAKARGALALELYVAESTPAKGPDDLKAMLPDHLAYQRTLEELGNLALAGPLWDRHRRIAKLTLPIWLYVSVTGVIIYWMLYHWVAAV